MNERILRIKNLMFRQGVIEEKQIESTTEEAVDIFLQIGYFEGKKRNAKEEIRLKEEKLLTVPEKQKKKLTKEIHKLIDIDQKHQFLTQAVESKPEPKIKQTKSKLNQNPTSQREAILFHLQEIGHITTFEAFIEYGITRLSARIYDLRDEGFVIEGEEMTKLNRFNHTCRFHKYILKNEAG